MSRLNLTFLVAFVLLAAYCLNSPFAHKTGQTGNSRIGCGGDCHGFAASPSTVVKLWTDSSQFIVGQQYTFHITIINSANHAGGCDISVDNGAKLALSGTSSGLKLLLSELTHTAPKQSSSDSITWTFLYTPTKPGTSHIYAAGNAVNLNNRSDQGDLWNTTVFVVPVDPSPNPSISVPTLVRDSALLGMTSTKTIRITNLGLSTLSIDRFSLTSGSVWSISDSSAHQVDALDSVAITVSFKPTSRVSYLDTLRIWSNDPQYPVASVALAGVGTAAKIRIDSPQVDFGQVKIGSSKMIRVHIYDTGTGPMTISQNELTQSDAFKLLNTSLPTVLGKKGGNMFDSVQFMPLKAGWDTAYIKLSFTETNEALGNTVVRDTSIMLIGEGVSDAAVQLDDAMDVIVSPNPSRGMFLVRSGSDVTEAIVTDASGRLITTVRAFGDKIDLSSFASGTYFLNIRQKEGMTTVRRIVIEH
jgi:hypothetical protein